MLGLKTRGHLSNQSQTQRDLEAQIKCSMSTHMAQTSGLLEQEMLPRNRLLSKVSPVSVITRRVANAYG